MASGPNVHGSLEKYLSNQQTRVTLLERRLALQGGGGNNIYSGQSFMTPTSVTNGVFDPATGRTNWTQGMGGVTLRGVFTPDYDAYRVTIFSGTTSADTNIWMRLGSGGTIYSGATDYFYFNIYSNPATPATGNGGTSSMVWLDRNDQGVHFAEYTVRVGAGSYKVVNGTSSGVGAGTGGGRSATIGGGMAAAFNPTQITDLQIGLDASVVTNSSMGWIVVEPLPAARQVISGGSGGSGAPVVGDIWQIGDGSTPPAGTLLCDGREVSRTTYASLFAKIGTTYGSGNNTTTFNLPNLNPKSATNTSTSVSRIAVDGIFPSISGSTNNVGADYWDIYYSIDLPGTASNELRTRFRASGSDITAAQYFHSRDGYSNVNLQGYVGGTDYFECNWGTVFNVSGTLRVYRAGKPNDWTNFEGTSSGRGSAYPEAVVQVGGSLQQASRLDGIVFYTAGGGYTIGTVIAVPAGGAMVPSVIAYVDGGGGSTPAPGANKGTTSDRNAAYPLPTNTTQQVALHNQKIVWQNTEKGWFEQYYAPASLGGVNAPGLIAGFTAGWYPIAGSDLRVHRGKTNGFQATGAATNVDPVLAASQINRGGWVDSGNSGVIPPVGGFYDIQARAYFSGAGAMSYVSSHIFRAGSVVTGDRRYYSGADTNTDARLVLDVQAGQVISLVAVSQAANNVWGTSGYDGCYLAVRYVAPPLVNG